MTSLWWLAMPVLLLPVWWHRQKRQRTAAAPLATARFLPRTEPQQRRVWRWHDRTLLLVRCLMLATVIAWLADLVVPWRGDTVLVMSGTDAKWAAQQVQATGFASGASIEMGRADVFPWLARHEREFQRTARILLVGDVPMPATKPGLAHEVVIRSKPAPPIKDIVRVAIVSKRAPQWRAMFAALDQPERFVIVEAPDANAALVIWDVPEAPPAGIRPALWWVGDATAFPELKSANTVDGLRYADSQRGRLWSHPAWPPSDAEAARAQFETWQRLEGWVAPYTAPPQTIAASKLPAQAPVNGALRDVLAMLLAALFLLERILVHALRR